MNCQPESEHESPKHPIHAEPPLMETLDYLRLASFIHYLSDGAEQARAPVGMASAEA
ncbi:MAG: hypothetical protein AAGC84_07830 [Pseudomonas sp.]